MGGIMYTAAHLPFWLDLVMFDVSWALPLLSEVRAQAAGRQFRRTICGEPGQPRRIAAVSTSVTPTQDTA